MGMIGNINKLKMKKCASGYSQQIPLPDPPLNISFRISNS
jgi:hypothetical protein